MNPSARGPFLRFLIFWFPVIAYCAIIFIGSAMEHPLPETQIPQLDKLLHAVEFGALCFLLIRALKGSFTGLSGFRLLAFAVILTTIYGATDEIHQLFVPGRVSSFIDLFFDFLGALAVGFLKR